MEKDQLLQDTANQRLKENKATKAEAETKVQECEGQLEAAKGNLQEKQKAVDEADEIAGRKEIGEAIDELREAEKPTTGENIVNAAKSPALNVTSNTINELDKDEEDYDKFLPPE